MEGGRKEGKAISLRNGPVPTFSPGPAFDLGQIRMKGCRRRRGEVTDSGCHDFYLPLHLYSNSRFALEMHGAHALATCKYFLEPKVLSRGQVGG